MHPKKQHQGQPDQEQQQLQQQANNTSSSQSQNQKSSAQPQQFTFGPTPISIKCPFCLSRIKTQIIMKPELISIMLGLAMFTFVPNAVMIVLVVLVLQISATKRHRCPLCQRQLGTDGQNGVLISKKILVTIGLFFLMVFGVYVRSTIANTHQWIDLSWTQLIEKCPKQVSTPNCNYDNIEKTIKNWKGYVMRVQDRRDSLRRYYDYALEIYLKMQPTETDKKQPDLYLTASTSTLFQITQILDNLKHGDEVIFNATFYPAGRGIPLQAQNRHLHIVDLNKTGSRREDIEIYMNKGEQEFFDRVDGGGLRKQNA